MTRPADLPDFHDPPLHEVVIGVQFAPARGYSQIYAGEVWAMFKSQYPNVEEHPPLPPTFETFGRPERQHLNLGFVTGAAHDRFWFLNEKRDELIQFQQDRLLHNWRKVPGGESSEYPRFEKMIEKFETELGGLEDYFSSLSPQTLVVNQCEVSYVNHIPCDEEKGCVAQDWLGFLDFQGTPPEEFSVGFRRIIADEAGKPIGRLICEAASAFAFQKRVIRLTLSARGAPSRPDIPAGLAFLHQGREIVVRAFAEITTESAHRKWQRAQ